MPDSARPLINLAAGVPDLSTPALALQRARTAMNSGHTTYTAKDGIPQLREMIAARTSSALKLEIDADEIVVTSGGKLAIFCVLASLLEADDEVVAISPYYAPYRPLTELAGGTWVDTPQRGDVLPGTWLEDLRRALTPRTRAILVNFPSNPSGAVASPDELKALARLVLDHPRAVLLSDEVYEAFHYDAQPHASPVALTPELRDRTVIVNAVSKTYGMTGWRVGWATGPRELIGEAATVQGHLSNCASSVSQWAALGALESPVTPAAKELDRFQRQRDDAVTYLNERTAARVEAPAGGLYLFPQLVAAEGSALRRAGVTDLVGWLEKEHGVRVASGAPYGAPNHVRLNFCVDPATLESGLARLAAATPDLLAPTE